MTERALRSLVLNAGSSSLKWSLFEGLDEVDAQSVALDAGDREARRAHLTTALDGLGHLDAVGHRIVFGGEPFTRPVLLDARHRETLGGFMGIDPLHMGPALDCIDAVTARWPTVPQVAAFDTAFHAQMPEASRNYALPAAWVTKWGLRRFGFHGLSVEYATRRATTLCQQRPCRLVVCHLGSGSSVTAVLDGHSIDTSMGFTPLDGVVMSSRCGSLDPGLILYLLGSCEVPLATLKDTLNTGSGLLGVSGISSDLRTVLEAADGGSAPAQLAYDELIWSLRRAIGAMVSVLGGLDALVFTGGIGEHSGRVRADACHSLGFLGLQLMPDAQPEHDALISAADSKVQVLMIKARENLIIAEAITALISS